MIAGTQFHEANDVPETGGSARRKTALEQASCTPTPSLWDSRVGCTPSTSPHSRIFSWVAHPPPHFGTGVPVLQSLVFKETKVQKTAIFNIT